MVVALCVVLVFSVVAPRADAAQETAARASHERMVVRLAEIARAFPHGAEFRALRDENRRVFDSIGPEVPIANQVRVVGVLADTELQVGNVGAAVSLFQVVLDNLQALPPDVRGSIGVTTVFMAAVAHLRQAQSVNCIENHTGPACIMPFYDESELVDRDGALNAMGLFGQLAVSVSPESPIFLATKWLVNVAALMLGMQSDLAPHLKIDPQVFAPETDFPRFRNVAPELGVATSSFAGGVIADDFDGDGLIDLMVSSLDTAAPLRVFRNAGDNGFEDVSGVTGLAGITGGLNLTHADYDNDGDVDVYIQRGAWRRADGTWPNSLLRNDGGFRFTDVAHMAGLAGDGLDSPTQTAAWADYDNDGDVDLYVGNETTDDASFPAHLFRNEGDGTFTEVAAAAGVTNDRWAKSVAWGDLDADGYEDLFVSNYQGVNRFYRNNRDGTFVDVAAELGVEGPDASFLSWFWDTDNDGNLDLLVNSSQPVAMSGDAPPIWQIAASRVGVAAESPFPRLFQGNGDGTVRDASAGAGIDRITYPMGANFGDLDNDGWLDHYLGTGYPTYEALMPNVMYRGLGGGRFEEITFAGGFGHLAKGHAIAFADFDHDGDQDVFEQMGGMLLSDPYPDTLYQNPGFDRSWLKLQLVGVEANRGAIGSRVRIDVDGPEGPRSLYRRVGTGASFGGNPLRVELGLGDATRIIGGEIRWAGSGTIQTLGADLRLDSMYRIVEGSDPEPVQLVPVDWSARIQARRR